MAPARAWRDQSLRTVGVVTAALVVGFHSHQAAASTVYSIESNRGSLGGQTRVTLWGAGFERDGRDGTTVVYFGANVCRVEDYSSTDTKLVCYSPPHTRDEWVQVKVATVAMNSQHLFARCSPESACTFQYSASYTPRVDWMFLGGGMGKSYVARGWLVTDDIAQADIKVGGSTCDVGEGGMQSSYVRCTLGDNTAGRYNMTVRIENPVGYGQAVFSRRGQQVARDGSLFQFTHHAHIDSLSFNRSGMVAGHELVIRGNGFGWDATKNQVDLAGVPCAVTSATGSELRCIVGTATQPTAVPPTNRLYPAGRGLLHRIYYGVNNVNNVEITSVSPSSTAVNTFGLLGAIDNEANSYTQDLTGFFVAPVSANYTFYTRGDDQCYVYLSRDESPDNATRIAYTSSYTAYWHARPAEQISAPIWMEGGQRYWMRVRHSEGSGGDFFDVAMRIHGEGNAAVAPLMSENQRRFASVPEIQYLYTRVDVVREVQAIELYGAVGGFFYVLANGVRHGISTSTPAGRSFPINVSPSALASGLNGIAGCPSISVVRTAVNRTSDGMAGWRWQVQFNCATRIPFALLSIDTSEVTGGAVSTDSSRIQSASEPLGGSFTVRHPGTNATSTPIPYNAGASTVKGALEAMAGIESVEVSGSLTNTMEGGLWQVTFWAPYGDMPLLEVSIVDEFGTSLTGTNATAWATEVQRGSTDPFYWPVPADFFETTLPVPAVRVTTNGILADCDVFDHTNANMACAFRYDQALTPTVSAVSAASVTAGDVLTVTGTGFLLASDGVGLGPGGTTLPISALNKVYLNDSVCTVTAATATQLTCTVQHAAAGAYRVRVEVGLGRGFAAVDPAVPSIAYSQAVTSVSPLTGSTAGGVVITITGTGFHAYTSGNVITVAGGLCTVLSASFSAVTCRVPAGSGNASISINGAVFASPFAYSAALTATVTALAPRVQSAALTGVVNITLSNVPTDATAATLSVSFGSRPCTINVLTVDGGGNAFVSCALVRGQALPLPQIPVAPTVDVAGRGYADAGAFTLDTGFRVTAMSTQVGSLEGGTELTFTGVGFSPLDWQNEVIFRHFDTWGYEWRHPCPIIAHSPDGTNLTCLMPPIPLFHRGDPKKVNASTPVSGVFWVKVNNITAPCADALGGCNFTQNTDATPTVTAWEVVPEPASPSGVALVLNGTQLPVPGMHVVMGGYDCRPIFRVEADTSLRCHIPIGTAGTVPVVAHVHRLGDARMGLNYTFPLTVAEGPTAVTGSAAGGTVFVLRGMGFATNNLERNQVYLGATNSASTRCIVLSANTSHLTAMTPPQPAAGTGPHTVTVRVMDADLFEPLATAAAPATFTYDNAITPTITSITPASGFAGTTISIVGTGFGASLDPTTKVMLGGVACAIINDATYTATTMRCVVGDTPAGVHRILLSLGAVGYAKVSTSITFTSQLEITATSTLLSSYGGGNRITLTGRGLAASAAVGSNMVMACNTMCNIVSASYTSLACDTAPVLTLNALAAFSHYLPGRLSGVSASPTAAFDGNVETTFTGCTASMDMGPAVSAVVTAVRFFPQFRQVARMRGGQLQASNDNVGWVTLATVGAQVQEAWNDLVLYNGPGQPHTNLGTLPTYRYIRFAFAGSSCSGAELQFIGVPVASNNGSCPVSITVDSVDAPRVFTGVVAPVMTTLPPAFNLNYTTAATPFVASISPNNGTALGGTLVTITGTGFSTTPADVTVRFNGVPCAVQTSTATTITCITGARDAIRPVTVAVNIAPSAGSTSAGLAVYDASRTYFRYLDRWSALTTWKYNEPPVAGDTVIIPEGQAVLLDVNTPRLFLVLVQGELIFDRKDVTFDAFYIFVHGGRFEVGTEAEPFLQRAVITAHGDRFTTIELPEVGAKMLAVMDRGGMDSHNSDGSHSHGPGLQSRRYSQGNLDLHGRPRKRVWTLLESTANAGTDVLTLSEDTDWEVGERLVVSCPGNYGGIEEVVIAQVLSARQYRLTAPLAHTHRSAIHPAGEYGHADIDMRAEVGLLSRNVILQGDDRSQQQMFGVHMGAFHGGVMRVENIEIRFCGQAGLLGRYCSHTHMLSDDWVSYIRGNSIHHSQQRATTIHATNYLQVRHNVAYDVFGHTIFVEDGVERWNTIEENLVIKTKPCYFCTDSDVKPANFWTASPTNIWRHNRAGGSTHFGFWFELPGNPLGPSYTPNYCPNREVLVEFFNNTAHSNSIGLRVYPHWGPSATPCVAGSLGQSQYLHNNTFFLNGEGTFHRVVGMVHHVNSRWVENGHGWGWRQFEDGVAYSLTVGNPLVRNGLFICSRSGSGCGTRAITMPQNEYWYGADSTFVNYGNSGVLAGCHSCESDANFKQGGYTYRWSGTRFVNSHVRTHWNPPRKCILWDLDGTLTGHVNGTVAPWYGYNDWPECPRDTVGTYQEGTVCNGQVMLRRMQIDWIEPRELDWVTMNISSGAGWGLVQYRPKEFGGWSFPAASKHEYRHAFRGSLVDWRRHRTRYSEPEYIEQGPHPTSEYVLGTWTWIDRRFRNQVRYGADQVERDDLQTVGVFPDPAVHQFGTGNRPDDQNKTWTVAINTINITDTSANRYMYSAWNVQCPPRGCDVPDQGPLGNATLWSDAAATWGGRKPAAGEDVTINATSYVIMDENPPKLGRLTILGRLEFRDGANRKLEADAIVVWGELVVGTPDAPFQNNAEIVLHGVRSSPAVVLDNNLFLSNKVMAVLGRVTLVGRQRDVVWTRLAATAVPGATSVTLTQSVSSSWSVGDRIVFSSTEFNYTQYEDVTITGVSGTTVTFSPPLRHRHFAGPVASGPGASSTLSTTYLRAAVGLLSRNVVLRGNLEAADDTYGAHMVVSSITRRNPAGVITSRREGEVDLRYVELRHCGKQRTEHGAILFQYGNFLFDTSIPATNPINHLLGVSFRESFNYGVVGFAAKHLVINNNVFHRHYRNSLDLDAFSGNATVTNNLFVGNLRSPDVNADDQIPWIRPQSAVFIDTVPRALSGNLVSGAVDASFTYRVPQCAADHARWYAGNEAHGVRIGAFLMATSAPSACVRLHAFTAWKAAHIGILSVDQLSNVEVTNAVVADNHIGISLNFIRSARAESFSRVKDSLVLGSTAASASCAESTSCLAVGNDDPRGDTCNSVLGDGYRRAGIVMPQYTNRGKTCDQDYLPVCRPPTTIERLCALPWERRYGTISTVNAAAYLVNVRFGLFAQSDCGRRSTAIVHNPTQIDQAVPHYARGIVWDGVEHSARFHLTWNAMTDEKCSDGVGCDSLNNMMLRDEDGSLLGLGSGAIAVGPNPTNIFPEPDCLARGNWSGFECKPTPRLVRGLLEAVDVGRVAMGPLHVTRRIDPNDNTTWRLSQSFGSIKDMCAKRGEQPLYAHFVTTGEETHMFWPATEPGQIRYRLFSTDPSDGLVVSVFIQRPYSWSLFVNGVEVPMLEAPNATHYTLPKPTDPIGTWLFHPQRRHIWFTARGHTNGAATWIDLVRKPTVQLNLHLAVSVEQFFGPDLVTNMALLLQIEPWRIKIVDVRPGSVQVKVEIQDSQPPVVLASTNDTETVAAATAQFERMQTLAQQVQTLASTGGLTTIGTYTVLSVAITPPVSAAVPSSDTGNDNPVVISPSSPAAAGLSPGAIAGIVCGIVLGVAVVAGGLLMYRRTASDDHTSPNAARRSSDAAGNKAVESTAIGPASDGVEFANPVWSRQGAPGRGPAASPMGAQATSSRVVFQPMTMHPSAGARV